MHRICSTGDKGIGKVIQWQETTC